MRMIRTLFALSVILLFASCQKELSFESTPNPSNNDAVFTLDTATGHCSGFVIAGTYTNGIAVNAGNTVKVQVSATKTGTYTISTNTVAGISFIATGSFTNTGAQTVTLTATGKPTSDGVKTFAVTAGSSTCNFDVTLNKPAPPATFTFAGAPSACTMPVINGTYSATTAVSASNTVVVNVNVTVAGSYNIVTNIVNGLSFSGSGVFTSTGATTVTLYATGTPATAGTTTLKFDGASSCSFDVPVAAAPVVTGNYSCKIDGVATTFTDNAKANVLDPLTNAPELTLDGYIASRDQELFINIANGNQSAITAGTYDEKHGIPTSLTDLGYMISIVLTVKNPDQSTTLWVTGSNLLTTNPPFTIVVTSITATRVKGTFSGKVKPLGSAANAATKNITEGVFDLPIQ